jgi:hypothetical protein
VGDHCVRSGTIISFRLEGETPPVQWMVKLGTRSSDDLKTLADAKFKKKELQAREGQKATADYVAAGVAERKKTARLRALREAKEADEAAKAAAGKRKTEGKPSGKKEPSSRSYRREPAG